MISVPVLKDAANMLIKAASRLNSICSTPQMSPDDMQRLISEAEANIHAAKARLLTIKGEIERDR